MRRYPWQLLVALAAVSCNSNLHFLGTPVNLPMSDSAAVRATMSSVADGSQIDIPDPTQLPAIVRSASYLQAGFGPTLVTVAREPNGSYSFVIPSGANVSRDVNGVLTVVFVMDRTASQIVKLATGSPVLYGAPAIVTTPGAGAIAHGQYVTLQANTNASSDQYDFTWSVSPSADGPWQPIPGDGKQITWTPLSAGAYYVNVDASDRKTHRVYSTISADPAVFVSDPRNIVTTDPTTGSTDLGTPVTLHFNAPSGFDPTGAEYSWSAGTTIQGPWTSIPGAASSLDWTPTSAADYFVRVDVSSPGSTDVNTFVSPLPVVFAHESLPLITASSTTVERGTPTRLTLNVPGLGSGPFNWFFAVVTGGPPVWLPAGTGGSSYTFVPTDVGSYAFRVDLPQADGTVKTFISPDPALNVVETVPVVVADPESSPLGATVTLSTDVPSPQGAPYSWYYLCQEETAPTMYTEPTWTVIDGTGPTVPFTPTEPGLYTFRVDVPEADGTVKRFINTQPALTITATTPVILASRQVAERGDALLLDLAGPVPAGTAVSWSYTTIQPSILVPTNWTPLPGTGNPLPIVLTDAGSYYFRADVPGPDGTLQTYLSAQAAVTVQETIPVIQSLPADAVVPASHSVALVLNAGGIDPTSYRLDWSVGTSGLGPWTQLPAHLPNDMTYTWQIPMAQCPGAYFVRVTATQIGGPASYDFVSSGPVVTVTSP